jgi:hypothetical protein
MSRTAVAIVNLFIGVAGLTLAAVVVRVFCR